MLVSFGPAAPADLAIQGDGRQAVEAGPSRPGVRRISRGRISGVRRSTGEPAATGDPCEQVERELALLLRRVRALTRSVAREVHPDLDPTAYGLLIRLEEVGHARLTDMAAYFGVGKPTLSRQLAALARLGLVRGREDPEDGRATRWQLTEDAARRVLAARRTRQGWLRAELERWPVTDVATLAELLRRLNSAG
jgi:DNA-binding MarR family transcriptional regulator